MKYVQSYCDVAALDHLIALKLYVFLFAVVFAMLVMLS